MGLFTNMALEQVLSKMVKGLRYIWPEPDYRTANKSAISQARQRLGVNCAPKTGHKNGVR
jgi:hypothetical protein